MTQEQKTSDAKEVPDSYGFRWFRLGCRLLYVAAVVEGARVACRSRLPRGRRPAQAAFA
jgi:hypothetical protein